MLVTVDLLFTSSNCDNVALAQDFLAKTFGSSTEVYDEALLNGGVISTYAPAGESEVYQAPNDYWNGQPIYATIVEMGTHIPVIEQSDFHYQMRTVLGVALTNAINGADLMTELEAAETQIRFEMGL